MKRYNELVNEEFYIRPSYLVANGTMFVVVFTFLIWVFNETGVFMIDDFIMRTGAVVSAVMILLAAYVSKSEYNMNSKSRYLMITCAVVVVFILNQLLPLWSGIFLALPVIFAGLYCDKKLLSITFAAQFLISLIEPAVSVLLGVLPAQIVKCLMAYMRTHAIPSDRMTVAGKAVLCVGVPNAIILCVLFFIVYQRIDYQRENIENKIAMAISRERDVLTKLNNRQSLNMRMEKSGHIFDCDSTFLYVDAREIEDVNKRLGVVECDRMLLEIATMLREMYGEDDTYRISASVFAAVIERPLDDQISIEAEELRARLKGIALACAVGIIEVSQGSGFDDIIKEMEKRRSADRVNYYGSSRNDRRRR